MKTLPTCLIGFVDGDLRWENCGGGQLFQEADPFLFMKRPCQFFLDEDPFVVTHLQKRSRFGFLIMRHEAWWQLCFHLWITPRFQAQNAKGGWIPGTETAFCVRLGWSRWDAGDCKYIKGEQYTIAGRRFRFPFGTAYLGLHYD